MERDSLPKMIQWLCRVLPYKEIGWHDIGETFYRFQLWKGRWFNIYLHALNAPSPHPTCHDHPWVFVTVLLKGGYWESTKPHEWKWRRAGSVLYRPATFAHNVITWGWSWSLIITTAKQRQWQFVECR